MIKNRINLGFAGGNNVGIKYALDRGADYVMILNNDTLVDKNLMIQLIKVMEDNPDTGIVSPKIYFAKGHEFHKGRYKKENLGKVIWYAGGKIDWKNVYGTNRGVDEVDRGQFNRIVDIDFATGSCMLVKKEVFKKIGFFDEKYFMYFEDVDFSLRVKNAGWRVIFTPSAILWHKVAQSSAIGSDLNDYFITRNRLLFGLRYAPVRSRIASIKESINFFWKGRGWQKIGARDFYLGRFGKGSWNEN